MGPRDHPRSRGVYWNPAIHDAKSNGSSPLARGLPAPAERPATGIADHPRSRGVYLWTLESSFAVAGSSPLARGLPGTYHAYGEVDRIIPARAGFTHPDSASTRASKDHPRSRGVYGYDPAGPARPVRIIPARAGFTAAGCCRSGRSPDHPRSRGVYRITAFRRSNVRGSSPLARGLPSTGRRRAASTADHPRSRGVYMRAADVPLGASGSSPLARGLPDGRRPSSRPTGIIPARAGFTSWTRATSAACSDHPRSRGVYPLGARPGRGHAGSSPLARGLRCVVRRWPTSPGIIPARAGFTCCPSSRACSPTDHPRSRGVY